MYLFDTHTHFDVPEYDDRRDEFNTSAYHNGVRHLVLIGYLARYFDRMVNIKQYADTHYPIIHHLACGLHPLYIREHGDDDLIVLDNYLKSYPNIAIGEIGLDTYPNELKDEMIYEKQKHFFIEQIQFSKQYDLPILLHIRKSHADVLKILKTQKYNANNQGGIAHSFSGGENEALSFVKMGFKIGITGQITNPNAKKLRQAVKTVYDKYGISSFVIETDCPDMMPLPCQHGDNYFNEPKNLIHVINELSVLFDMDKEKLSYELWQNSNDALKTNFAYSDKMIAK
ncbi:TatD family hydrolase [Moraxella oblonga]|uniref:TatD family hydrolase n=1 Tax=Moraxella oblonga TaxID=200413 RepID=UPI00082FCAF3|nr:TatD family hydrolase [Moraxella oblonga]